MAKKIVDFSDRSHSPNGRLSTVCGVVGLIILVGLTVASIVSKGELGAAFGILGLTDIIIGIYGLIMGISSFKEEETLLFYKKLGLILNIILLIIIVSLFVIGFMV